MKLQVSLLIMVLVILSVLTACPAEMTPTPMVSPLAPTAVTPAPTEESNWWDEFGDPEYGETLTIRAPDMPGANFDPFQFMGHTDLLWFERLFCFDWTLDRTVFPFTASFAPAEYYQGLLAESWEQIDPLTITVKIREEAHWQDKVPLNGRGVTAHDVQYTYDRYLGSGSGFTEPHPIFAGQLSLIERVVAKDDYTVVFELKKPNAMAIYQIMESPASIGHIVAPELVEQNLLQDWDRAVGTGAWIPTDFSQDSSMTCSRNTNYWRYDERYHQNQLPYIDTVKMIAIADMSTALAAMRTGKIDMILSLRGGLSCQQSVSLAKTDPDIQQAWWANPGASVALRCDTVPFNDIRVRKALQLAINRQAIAENHYLGTVDGMPAGLLSPLYTGWTIPYAEWPSELQEEYSYNPEKARQLLAEAGYPDGFDTNCIASNADDIVLLEIIKSEFMDIGVNMEIITMDQPTFMSYAMAGKQDQMTLTATCGMPMNPDKDLIRYTSTNRENYAHTNDSEYDAMYSQFAAAATTDEAKRLSIEMQMYALGEHWAVNVCPYYTPIVWHPWVKGYSGEQMIPPGGIGYYLAPLWIDRDLKASMGY